MAKFELKFKCSSMNGNSKDWIKCEREDFKKEGYAQDFIVISMYNESNYDPDSSIWLDKSTAIKLAKTLRTEINKMTESEVNNG